MATEKFKVCPECGDEVSEALARATCNKCDVLYKVAKPKKKPAAKPRKKA